MCVGEVEMTRLDLRWSVCFCSLALNKVFISETRCPAAESKPSLAAEKTKREGRDPLRRHHTAGTTQTQEVEKPLKVDLNAFPRCFLKYRKQQGFILSSTRKNSNLLQLLVGYVCFMSRKIRFMKNLNYYFSDKPF